MESEYISIDDISDASLPFYLRADYKQTPPSQFADYINRVAISYSRRYVDTRHMTVVCRFNAQSSEFGSESHLFLNFTVCGIKEMGINLQEFLSTPEITGYELYDIGVSTLGPGDRLFKNSEYYDQYEVTVWFRLLGSNQ